MEVGADAKITCKVTNSKHDGHVAFEMNNRVIAQLPTQEGGGFFFTVCMNLTNLFYIIHQILNCLLTRAWLPKMLSKRKNVGNQNLWL